MVFQFFKNNYVLLLAIYGSVLSTFGVIWKIYSDRPKIKVNAKFGFMSGERAPKEHFLFITAINKGKRLVNLSSVGIRCEKNDLLNIKTISLPHKLSEGESHTEWFEVEELKGKPCSFAWYRTQTGKLYRSKSISQKLKNYWNSREK